MADWTTIASLCTATGTLALAAATFSSVRSANRAARASEESLLVGLRPLLVPSRREDPPDKVGFQDNHWVQVPGGGAIADVTDEAIYLVLSLRNVGRGIAVLDRWSLCADNLDGERSHDDPEHLRRLTRDLYVPPSDRGFWQGALRDRSDPDFASARDAIEKRRRFSVDLLYRDYQGGQRIISRFVFNPASDRDWFAEIFRHWNLDRPEPR
jgi:hypothetical protein